MPEQRLDLDLGLGYLGLKIGYWAFRQQSSLDIHPNADKNAEEGRSQPPMDRR